jgi:hypothetical protein
MQTIDWPFLAAEALAAEALTFRELRRFHSAIYPAVWAPRGVDLSICERARAAWLWSGRKGVIAGLTASAISGAKWVRPDEPVELIHTNRRPPHNMIVHTDELHSGERELIAGLSITSPARTAFDLGRRHSLAMGVQRIDALMSATGIKVDDVLAVIEQHPGVRGLRQLRETLGCVDGGAESPQESVTRLLLVRAGIPKPETQIEFFDEHGRAHIRVDMGWVVIRVSAEMLNRPQVIVERVRAALVSRGCPSLGASVRSDTARTARRG